MGKKVTIEDTMQDRVEEVLEAAKQALAEKLKDQSLSYDKQPELDELINVNEEVDAVTPFMYADISEVFYFHDNEAEDLFEGTFGVSQKDDDKWPAGWKAAAIYLLIEEKVREAFAEQIDEWMNEYRKEAEQ